MGILETMLTGMGGGGGGTPLEGVLGSLLGGGAAGGAGGNLQGLVQRFEQAGLGHIAQSWIGNGPNQPVSPDQLQQVLGEQQVQGMANQAGMAPQSLLATLAAHLPGLVDRLTPNGRMPESGEPDGTIRV